MKKTIFLSIMLVFALTGCFEKKGATVTGQNDVSKPETGSEQVAPEKKLGLMEWFKLGKGVECTIQSDAGEIKTFSLRDKVRMEGLGFDPAKPGEIGTMINDGQFLYTWFGETGTKIPSTPSTGSGQVASTGSGQVASAGSGQVASAGSGQGTSSDEWSWEDSVSDWENSDAEYDCREASLGDDTFTPPTNVNFVDLGAMMGGLDNANENVEQQLRDEKTEVETTDKELEAALEKFRE